MESEIWKDVPDYESHYSISNMGNIFSKRKQKHLSPGNNGKNYLFVHLYKEGSIKRFYVHRLVAFSFIENPENKNQINHKDCDKSNNNVSNLEWCTLAENMRHASINNRLYCSDFQKMQTSLANSGSKSMLSKISEKDALEIKKHLKEGIKTQKQIADIFKITRSNVSAIYRGISWKQIKI